MADQTPEEKAAKAAEDKAKKNAKAKPATVEERIKSCGSAFG